MTELHHRREGDLIFWKRLDMRWKVVASLVGSIVMVTGSLWGGVEVVSRVTRKVLDTQYVTKVELAFSEDMQEKKLLDSQKLQEKYLIEHIDNATKNAAKLASIETANQMNIMFDKWISRIEKAQSRRWDREP